MQLLTKKFTQKDYEKMIESAILTTLDRVELIRGEIIEMSPIGLKHGATVIRLTNFFPSLLGNKALISVQNSVQLDDYSQPEPDVVLLKNREDFYATKRPTSSDIFLLIEVSDSSYKYDQEIKLPLYAENKVQEVWIINLNNDTIEVYRYPENNFYQQRLILTQKENISCLAFSEISIPVTNLFPFQITF
jgi:Uma2 family endonuclease